MQKRERSLFFINTVFFQIILLLSMSFAFSFMISESFVSGESPIPYYETANHLPPPTNTPLPIASQTDAAAKVAEIVAEDSGEILGPHTNGPLERVVEDVPLTGGVQGSFVDPFATSNYKAFGMLDTGISGLGAHLAQGAVWAGVAYGLGQVLGGLFGFDKRNKNALSYAGVAGVMTYKAIGMAQYNYFGTGLQNFFATGPLSSPILPALAVTAIVFILLYKKTEKKTVSFQCLPFEAPLGGSKCEDCNKDPFKPCSEYRCKSLGQTCELLNKGNVGRELCTKISKFDAASPTITPWNEVLSPKDLKYIKDTSIRPPALGVKVVKNDGCLQAYTPLQFGITTNEPAQCKIDYNHTAKFDDMQFYFGEENYYAYNHTQKMKLPSPDPDSEGAPFLKNDGTFSLYVRCRDGNGNENVDEFAVSFCVDKSPDTTPPIVQRTSIDSGSPVRFNVDVVPIQVFTNEPSECKWSNQDKAYADMENGMECDVDGEYMNSDLEFPCVGNLTGIKNKESNSFYFRCTDQPNKEDKDRNVMSQSYKLDLRGSQELNIVDTSPNGTIFGSTSSVDINLEVETSNGANEGRAFCYFSNNRDDLDSFIPMFETNNFKHTQSLTLGAGNYNYYFRCIDAGGNTDLGNVSFRVFVDRIPPLVTRAYKELDAIKIVTNEDAECSYSLNNCNFDIKDGIKMINNPVDKLQNAYAEWKTGRTYFIKCKDKYGNEPAPNACSLIARAAQLEVQPQEIIN